MAEVNSKNQRFLLISSLFLFGALPLFAADPFLECRIIQVTQEEVFTDCGYDDGLAPADFGTVIRGGAEINRVRVLSVSHRSSRSRIMRTDPTRIPTTKDTVVFVVPPSETKPAKEKEFVPLLAPSPKSAIATSANIFHGRLRLRRLIRQSPRDDVEYTVSRVGTDGSVDRLFGTKWSLTWSGDGSYKDGQAYVSDQDYHEARLILYSALLQGNFSKGGIVRAGRFLPNEIYTFGYLEGVQWHVPLSKKFSLGTTAGYKPDPLNLNSTTRQPNTTQYVSFTAGQRQWVHSTTLVGIHHAFFDDQLDRRAMVIDQQFNLGSKFYFQGLSELDFDVHTSTREKSNVNITRLNLSANANLLSVLSLRAGLERSQRPDNRAERDILGTAVEDSYFDQVYRRIWGGGSLQLPLSLSLDGDVSYYKESPQNESPAHWRGTLTRRGLPFLEQASLGASLYNLRENNTEFLGGLSTLYLPFGKGRFNIFASWGMREFATAPLSKEWKSTDYSLQCDWRVNKKIHLRGGLTHSFPIYVESDLIDISLDYRW